MASQIYICRQCGCPDLVTEKTSLVIEAKDRKAACPNCKWEGPLSEAAGIYTKDKVYDTKEVVNLLLHVTTKHAAGPIAQALEFIGLLEKGDDEGRNVIMRAALEGLIRESFVAAAEHAAKKGNMEKHGHLETTSEVNPASASRISVVEQKDEVSEEERKAMS